MGYHTDFHGCFKFNRPVDAELVKYINRFGDTRRMKRDVDKIRELYPDWEKYCFKGMLGVDGEYFIGGEKEDIINYNLPPATQPGLWCQWIIGTDLQSNGINLAWDGGEKFYCYEEWLDYLIDNFFEPLGYVLNGDIEWQGEESDDFGIIHVKDNFVEMQYGIRVASMSELSTEDLVAELKSRGFDVTPLAV